MPPAEEASPEAYDEAGDGKADLYGNEVTAAVAKYGVNRGGTLYEIHAPNVGVVRLAPPKS